MKKYNYKLVKSSIEKLLDGLGVNWREDENFKETPGRVARAMREFNQGLYEKINSIKTFNSNYDGIVLLKSINAIGLCPHHLLPISYEVSFAYIPAGKVLGLSKIPRIIKLLCARPMLQEDLTKDITTYFEKKLKPVGTATIVRGTHGCMKYRGVKEADEVRTTELSGAFFDSQKTRSEFYAMLKI